jgi:two-component system NtrC family sensor kinase
MIGRWGFRSLTLKLLLAVVGAMVLITAGQGLFSALHIRRGLETAAYREAEGIADLVRRSTRASMLEYDREGVQEMMDSIAAGPSSGHGIVRMRIFNKSGQIIYSSDKGEIGKVVDNRTDPACVACHRQGRPPVQLDSSERMRTFREPGGSRTLGVIQPVENEKACSEAECHAHDPGQRILGVLDVNRSLQQADRATALSLKQMLVVLLVSVAAAAAVAVLFVLLIVRKPVALLIEGTQRAAAGDLAHVIRIDSRDELGVLAADFNDMTRKLREAMDVVRDWNVTLQERVAERTDELQRAQDHLLRVERMATLGRLAAIIAHEINNPLAGIRTYARLLQKRGGKPGHVMDEEDLRCLGLMESEAARCGDIVLGLLQFSRKEPIHLEKHAISQLAEEALRLVKHRLDLQNLQVIRHLAPDLPELACNGQQVVQALIAVLINACEAMPGEGTLEVSTGAEAEGAGVWVRVQDTGVGMDAKTLEGIFEPFFSTKQETSGVGLGLAVVYGIVQRHGGRIEVQSEPGQGSAFTLHFPLEPPDRSAGEPREGKTRRLAP